MHHFPYQSFTSFDTSQQAPFSPPESSSPYLAQTPPNQQNQTSPIFLREEASEKKVKWSKEATVVLISAWLNTSKDSIVGYDQTSSHFWDRIAEYFNLNYKDGQTRTTQKCKDHQNKIDQKVARFNGCYKRVQEAHHSGWSEELVLENVQDLYKSENKNSSFQPLDCWRLLRNEPKWNTMLETPGTKKAKVFGLYTSSSSSPIDLNDFEVSEERPIGQKMAKKIGKKEMTCMLHSWRSTKEKLLHLKNWQLQEKKKWKNKELLSTWIILLWIHPT